MIGIHLMGSVRCVRDCVEQGRTEAVRERRDEAFGIRL